MGADKASMKTIAAAAGVNSALLYQHFATNGELFEVAILRPLKEAVDDAISRARSEPSPLNASDAILRVHEVLLDLMAQVAVSLGVTLFSDKYPGRQFFSTEVEPVLATWIRETLEIADSSRSLVLSPELLASALTGIHLTLALDAEMREVDLDRGFVLARLLDAFPLDEAISN
jgi:AcrR family transcriptional regulator